MWNLLVGSFHPTLIISDAWVISGAALMICEGKAICYALLFAVGVILVVRFWSAMAGDFYDVADVIIRLYDLSGKEGAPQSFISLDGLLSFYFEGT